MNGTYFSSRVGDKLSGLGVGPAVNLYPSTGAGPPWAWAADGRPPMAAPRMAAPRMAAPRMAAPGVLPRTVPALGHPIDRPKTIFRFKQLPFA